MQDPEASEPIFISSNSKLRHQAVQFLTLHCLEVGGGARLVTETHYNLNQWHHHTNPGNVIQKNESGTQKVQKIKGEKKGSKRPAPETEGSQDDSVSQLLGVTIAAINATKDLVPIDLAKGILGTIANILTLAQSVIKNKSDFQAIADKCETIREILGRATKDATEDDLRGHLGHALSQLNKSVNRINSDVASSEEQGFWRRFFTVTIDRDKITAWEKDLDCVLGLFNFEAIAGMGIDMKLVKKALELMGNDPKLTNLVINDEHLALIGPGGMGKSSVAKAIINEPLVMEKFAVILILTSRSRRNVPNVEWITKDIPALDLSSAQAVFFRIYHHASRGEAEEDIKGLLKELDFHPLSVNILANAAQQNGWSPATLLKRWNDRHSKVLDAGKGKLQSLSNTMQLSLSSPSVQDLGEDGLRVLAIIAFLPQGLNEGLASDLLSSLPQVDAICDVLCMQSLVYRQDNFLKVLAPIQHYVRDSLQAPDSTSLREIRAFYYRTVAFCSKERDQYADIIISDHVNIEHVVAFDLADIPDDAEETYKACWQFLERLGWHLPRPTTLTPAISNIVENSSTWTLKADCLLTLARLYDTLSQLVEASQAFQAAEALYLTTGDPERMGDCLINRADMLRCQGHFIQSQNLLEDLQHSNSWESLSETTKARAWSFLDMARMYTFTASADELFVKSAEDHIWGLDSKIQHWQAKFYHGGDAVQVNTHLKDLFMQHAGTGEARTLEELLHGLADVAYCEGRLSEAMDILQKIIEMDGQSAEGVLWSTVWKAHVVSEQGDYNLARELIRQALESFQFFALRSARTFLHQSYGSACIELAAGAYDRAASHFTTTIEGCDMQGNLTFKALSMRGLGEIAFAHSNFILATQRFEETRSLQIQRMVVIPGGLYTLASGSVLTTRTSSLLRKYTFSFEWGHLRSNVSSCTKNVPVTQTHIGNCHKAISFVVSDTVFLQFAKLAIGSPTQRSPTILELVGCLNLQRWFAIAGIYEKCSKQPARETEKSQDDTVSQLLGVTIVAINATKDPVPIDLAKGRLSDAMDNLETLVGIFEGQHSDDALRQTVRKPVVASKQGNCDLARELVQKASKPFQFFALRSARVFLHRSYDSACIALTAGECDKAETYFTTTIEACEINFALAMQRFDETWSFCAEICMPLNTLPDIFEGWALF
ncbi:hypothetical protein F4604DRAFT_1677546 [Suillus subluteus]|nr:hypothetical protein F4604DRAFT_1677546 [Suillus subluteus]